MSKHGGVRKGAGRPSKADRKFKRKIKKAYNRAGAGKGTSAVLESLSDYGKKPKKRLGTGAAAGIMAGAGMGAAALGKAISKATKRLNDSGRYGVNENPIMRDIVKEMFRGSE